MTRIGKIARLPHIIRSLLNERLRDGQDAKQLLEWLNALPQTKEVVDQNFNGALVTPQNLSEWRQGGYAEWLRQQDSLETALNLTEQAQDLWLSTNEADLSAHLANVLLVELARTSRDLLSSDVSPQDRWNHLREILPALNNLRRAKTHADHQRILEEQWTVESTERDTSMTCDEIQDQLYRQEMAELSRLPTYPAPKSPPQPPSESPAESD